MKKYIFISLVALFALVACTKEHASNQKITYYPVVTLEGDDPYCMPVGSKYEDPGFSAVMAGKDVTDQVVVTSNVDASKIGTYAVSYYLVNEDGFSSTKNRQVIVYNPDVKGDISGAYKVQSGSYRLYWSSGAKTGFADFDVDVDYICPGMFKISDLMGGYYDQRAGYGPSYAMSAVLALNADNTLTAFDAYVPGWGDSYDVFEASCDPEAGTISIYLEYAKSMEFHITLAK